MNTFWTGSPTTSTPVGSVPIGAVVNDRGASLWRVESIIEANTAVALHVVRYRGRSHKVICVAPGGRVNVVNGATRPSKEGTT